MQARIEAAIVGGDTVLISLILPVPVTLCPTDTFTSLGSYAPVVCGSETTLVVEALDPLLAPFGVQLPAPMGSSQALSAVPVIANTARPTTIREIRRLCEWLLNSIADHHPARLQ